MCETTFLSQICNYAPDEIFGGVFAVAKTLLTPIVTIINASTSIFVVKPNMNILSSVIKPNASFPAFDVS